MRLTSAWIAAAAMVLAGCGPDGAPAGPTDDGEPAASFPRGRLGEAVRPVAYRLELTVLPEQPEFGGITEIDVELAVPVRVMYLHGNGLRVSTATLRTPTGRELEARYAQLDDTGVASLSFPDEVPAGPATLRLAYEAPFRERSQGLFRVAINGRSYAFTQFQAIDARRAFPGFDEPAFKTPFDIAVTTSAENVVVGNTPVEGEAPAGEGLKRVVLATTKPLPTYLVALGVGPFDVVEAPALPPNAVRDRPLPLGAVATRGKGEGFRYALEITAPLLEYLEEYFAYEYPYAKLDLIATPEFGASGMENAGAIVYAEAPVLLPEGASLEQQRGLGVLHAHELAHQWFGDLVTPKWWDDTWLNEGFASWMSMKAAQDWRPEFELDVVQVLQSLAVMNIDSRIAARRIRQPVGDNLAIVGAFDGITYLKGSAVLAMFEGYLGEAGFRAGIRRHMQRFTHGVADVEDFMASLAEGSGRPDIVPAFRSFIDQAGVPLVAVELDCTDGRVSARLQQSRYLPLGSRGDPGQTWQIPVCLRSAGPAGSAQDCALLSEPTAEIALSTTACPAFVMPNAGAAGYYRFALDREAWGALLGSFGALGQKEALAAADSLSAAYRGGQLDTGTLVSAWRTIARSAYAPVALAPDDDLLQLRDYLAPPGQRPRVLALMRELYAPRLAALDQVTPEGEGGAPAVASALFRTRLTRFLALEADDEALRARLADQALRYLGNGEADGRLDRDAVPPALTGIALAAGVRELGAPFAERLIAQLLVSDDAQFRVDAAAALGNTDDAALGQRVRGLLLDERLRGREPTTLASALASRPSQRRATFEWFKANQDAFIARLPTPAHRWLPRLGAGFCTLAERDELEAVFLPLKARLYGTEVALAETLEAIELCAALVQARRDEVRGYFGQPPAVGER